MGVCVDWRRKFAILVGVLSAWTVGAASGVISPERVEVFAGAITLAPCGRAVWENDFSKRDDWRVGVNYGGRLSFDWGDGNGLSLQAVSKGTNKQDSAWCVISRTFPIDVSERHFSLHARMRSDVALANNEQESTNYWSLIRWYDAGNREIEWCHLPFACTTGCEDIVRIDGVVPRRAKGFSIQLGFDNPNIVGKQSVCYRSLQLTVRNPDRGYVRRGSFESGIRLSGRVDWSADIPAGTTVRFQAKSGEALEELERAKFVGPDGTVETYFEGPFVTSGTYCRYRAELLSDGVLTPVLRSVRVDSRVDELWVDRPDGLPPQVRLLMPSPTLDRAVRPTFEVKDESPIDWKSLSVSVDGKSVTDRLSRAGDRVAIDGPVGPWTNGIHSVDVAVADVCGNSVVARKQFYVGEIPPGLRQMSLRKDGAMLVDGQPFFPVGIYSICKRAFNGDSYDRAFQELAAAGFNIGHTYVTPWKDGFHEAAERNGFLTWQHARRPNEHFEKVARPLKDIAVWYLGDDTSRHEKPLELQDYNDNAKAVDPTRLTAHADVVNAHRKVSAFEDYAGRTDVFLPEIYPVWSELHQDVSVAQTIRDMKRIWRDHRLSGRTEPFAVWPIIQTFRGWGWNAYPTRDGLIASTYAALVWGGLGMTWYSYAPLRPTGDCQCATSAAERWRDLTELSQKISGLSTVLLGKTCPRPAFEVLDGPEHDPLANDSISLLLKKTDNGLWLFAVNSATSRVRVRISVAGLIADVRDEDRWIAIRDGSFVDDFEKFAVHVYRIR